MPQWTIRQWCAEDLVRRSSDLAPRIRVSGSRDTAGGVWGRQHRWPGVSISPGLGRAASLKQAAWQSLVAGSAVEDGLDLKDQVDLVAADDAATLDQAVEVDVPVLARHRPGAGEARPDVAERVGAEASSSSANVTGLITSLSVRSPVTV